MLARLLAGLIAPAFLAAAPASAPAPTVAAPPANAPSATPPAPPAEPALAAAPAPGPDPLDRELEALAALADGKLPGTLALGSLFALDLADEVAVEEARRALLARIAKAAPAPAAGTSPPEAGPVPPPPGGPVEPAVLAVPDRRLVERDRLRLAVLSLPPEGRAALVAAERDRLQVAADEARARRAREEAAAAERRAEAARLEAIEEAARARTAATVAIAGERARVEAARGALAAFQTELAALRTDRAEATRRSLDELRGLEDEAAAPTLDPAAAAALYDRAVAALVRERKGLARALSDLQAPSRVPGFEPELDTGAPAFAGLEETAALRAALDGLRREAGNLSAEEAELRRAEAAERAAATVRLNDLRTSLLPRLDDDRRARILGLGRDGFAQLLRELDHVGLMARWYPRARAEELRRLPARLSDLAAVGSAGWTMVQLLFLCGAAFFVARRQRSWLRVAGAATVARLRSHDLRVLAGRWLGHVGHLVPDALRLVFLVLVFDLVEEALPPEGVLLRDVLLAWAWYRLVLAAAYRFLTSAATLRRAELSHEQRERIRRSIGLAGRYALGVVVFLMVSARVLGEGYLHHVVVEFAWLGALPIGLVILRDWRGPIATSYLAAHPTGALAGWVERNRDRPAGALAMLAALGWVAARGVGGWFRDTALGFDHTRKALAYLFRRRLERHADAVGRGPTEIEALPAPLLAAFAEAPATPELAIDRFPGLPAILDRANRLAAGGPGGAVALVGERGVGKTTWLRELCRRAPAGLATVVTPEERPADAAATVRLLAGALGVEAASAEELAARLEAAPPRLVVVDGAERLLLRRVGGLAPVETFAAIAGRTSGRILWTAAFADHAFEHLRRVRPSLPLFAEAVALAPWTEDEIGRLVRHRMDRAGCEATYEDLVVERIDGTEFENEVIRTAGRYLRLLWDYADGNPADALHFWLRSLVPAGDERKLRVRLFDAPGADDLDDLPEAARFLLAAVLFHEALGAAEAAAVLGEDPAWTGIALERLRGRGVLERHGEVYRIPTRWHRAAVRFLRRQHLVFA